MCCKLLTRWSAIFLERRNSGQLSKIDQFFCKPLKVEWVFCCLNHPDEQDPHRMKKTLVKKVPSSN